VSPPIIGGFSLSNRILRSINGLCYTRQPSRIIRASNTIMPNALIKPREGYFPITSIHRMDLEQVGFDAAQVDDQTMMQIADKMAQAYLNNGFWTDLDIIAEGLERPVHIQ
jgi:hypothetical protein